MTETGADALPQGWVVTSIGDITAPSRPRHQPSDYPHLPFIGMEHIEAHTMRLLDTVPAHTMKSSAVHFWPGDVLYGRLRPYLNKVYRPEFEGLCSAEFIVFPASEHLDSTYVQYYLNSSDFVSFASRLNTGDRPRVDFEQLASRSIPLAPLPEQRRIVAEVEKHFTRLEASVAELERAQANLKRYRAAVLKAACEGRLVATEAELARAEGREYEPASILLDRILRERRSKWEADQLAKMQAAGKQPKDDKWKAKYREPTAPDSSGLPELSEGWAWATIEQLASPQPRSIQSGPFGSALHHTEFRDSGVLAIGIDNVLEGKFSKGLQHRISSRKFDELMRFQARPRDVLITVMATVGRCCVVPADLEPAIITKHVYRISANAALILPSYLMFALWGGKVVRDQILDQIKGQTRPGINGEILRRLAVPLPPMGEQGRIIQEVERRLSVLDELEATVERGLNRAEGLRQAILKRAFQGRLVPQDPNDEPASVLLERIRADRSSTPQERKIPRGGAKVKGNRKLRGKTERTRSLAEVLESVPDGMTADQLLRESGHTVETIDDFYAELKRELEKGRVEEVRPSGSDAILRRKGK